MPSAPRFKRAVYRQLAQLARISVANTSQHLQVLRAASLVEPRRQGLHRVYRLYASWTRDAVMDAGRPSSGGRGRG